MIEIPVSSFAHTYMEHAQSSYALNCIYLLAQKQEVDLLKFVMMPMAPARLSLIRGPADKWPQPFDSCYDPFRGGSCGDSSGVPRPQRSAGCPAGPQMWQPCHAEAGGER